jgi:hypothetical protein
LEFALRRVSFVEMCWVVESVAIVWDVVFIDCFF